MSWTTRRSDPSCVAGGSFAIWMRKGGTMTVAPTYVVSGATGSFLTFPYTAGSGRVSGGTIAVTLPTEWSTPSTGCSAGGVGGTCLHVVIV